MPIFTTYALCHLPFGGELQRFYAENTQAMTLKEFDLDERGPSKIKTCMTSL